MITETREREHPTEEEVDATLEDSFPASDPPGWTLGIDDATKAPAHRVSAHPEPTGAELNEAAEPRSDETSK